MIKISKEVKTFVLIENATHKVKLNEETLDNLKSEGKTKAIQAMIQKKMRQIVEDSTGEWWESSWKEFYKALTDQTFLAEHVEENKNED